MLLPRLQFSVASQSLQGFRSQYLISHYHNKKLHKNCNAMKGALQAKDLKLKTRRLTLVVVKFGHRMTSSKTTRTGYETRQLETITLLDFYQT